MPTLTNRWAVLVLSCFAHIAMGLQFQAIPAIAPFLIAEPGLNYTQVGLLIGLFLFPGAFGGLLGARYGDKVLPSLLAFRLFQRRWAPACEARARGAP